VLYAMGFEFGEVAQLTEEWESKFDQLIEWLLWQVCKSTHHGISFAHVLQSRHGAQSWSVVITSAKVFLFIFTMHSHTHRSRNIQHSAEYEAYVSKPKGSAVTTCIYQSDACILCTLLPPVSYSPLCGPAHGCCRIKIQSEREISIGWGLTGGGEGVCRHVSWLCGCSCSASSGAATCWAQMPSSVWKPLASIGNQRSVMHVEAETQT